MVSALISYTAGIVLLLGAAFTLVAAIGVIRLPDLLARMHAASKAGAVGGGLILLAIALLSQDMSVATRAIVGVIFLLLTTPLAAHLLARSTYISGHAPITASVVDDIHGNDERNLDSK